MKQPNLFIIIFLCIAKSKRCSVEKYELFGWSNLHGCIHFVESYVLSTPKNEGHEPEFLSVRNHESLSSSHSFFLFRSRRINSYLDVNNIGLCWKTIFCWESPFWNLEGQPHSFLFKTWPNKIAAGPQLTYGPSVAVASYSEPPKSPGRMLVGIMT